MRLIDADKLPKYTGYALSASDVAIAVENAPTVDAVPVIRCRECKWFAEGKWCRNPNNDMVQGGTTGEWFCADGERKGGAEDAADN